MEKEIMKKISKLGLDAKQYKDIFKRLARDIRYSVFEKHEEKEITFFQSPKAQWECLKGKIKVIEEQPFMWPEGGGLITRAELLKNTVIETRDKKGCRVMFFV